MVRTSLYDIVCQAPCVWAPFCAAWDHVALSSRVRVARNLAAHCFPARASASVLEALARRLLEVTDELDLFDERLGVRIPDIQPIERDLLVERRLISRDLGRGGPGRAFAADHTHHLSVLINEEDHLRLQVILPGMAAARAFDLARTVERRMEERLVFAYDSRLGYLTSCPSNLGTGLRLSVMMHLPALALCGHLESVSNALHAVGCSVRGALGEGSEGTADLYQVSNEWTLGETEHDILERVSRMVDHVILQERNARLKLVREQRTQLCDHVGRAYGILRHARRMSADEALNGISALIVGVRFGLVRRLPMDALNNLFLAVQPGHMCCAAGRELSAEERDEQRADAIRRVLQQNDH